MRDALEDIDLEPAAKAPMNVTLQERASLSMAISFKRIADALDGTTMGVDVSESLAGLNHAAIYGKHGT